MENNNINTIFTSSEPTLPTTIIKSVIPISTIFNKAHSLIGFPATGNNCLTIVYVNGLSLIPVPPCKITPFVK